MARVTSEQWKKDNEARRGAGGGRYPEQPRFLRNAGKHVFACIALAHVRGKAKGTWGVAALMICVDPGFEGQVAVPKCWTENQIHGMIAGAYGYQSPYENGLPSRDANPDKFDAQPDLLKEMLSIMTCADQKKGGKGDDRANWLPTLDVKDHRSPYVEIVMKEGDRRTKNGEPILECGFINPVPGRGDAGPYHVKDYRKALMSADTAVATAWFYADCEKMVDEACKAAEERARGGSGGGDEDDDDYRDDNIPF